MIDRLGKGICSILATTTNKGLKFKLYMKLSNKSARKKSANQQKNGQTHSQRNSSSE